MTSLDDRKELDVSVHPYFWTITCPIFHCGLCPYETLLILDDDVVTKTEKSLCGWSESQREYSELGSVEKSSCCCFVCVDSELGTIIPGWGCDATRADEIVNELNGRAQLRREPGYFKRVKDTQKRIEVIESKLDQIIQNLPISAPNVTCMDARRDDEDNKEDQITSC